MSAHHVLIIIAFITACVGLASWVLAAFIPPELEWSDLRPSWMRRRRIYPHTNTPVHGCPTCHGVGWSWHPTRRRWPIGRGLKQRPCHRCDRWGVIPTTRKDRTP